MGKGKRGGGGLGGGQNMQQLMQQAQKMQSKMEAIQEELKTKVIEAQSGGGAVRVSVNGNQELLDIVIDPAVLEDKDVEMLQDTLKAAIKEAMKKSKELSDQMMGENMGVSGSNLPFPGMF